MTTTALTVNEWTPNQRSAARLLAIGYTGSMAAERVGVTRETVSRWLAKQEFADYVQSLHEQAWERIEPAVNANLALALDVQRRVFAGEIKASDGRYVEARRFIERILDRLARAEQPPATGSTSTINLQLNTNGHHPNGA